MNLSKSRYVLGVRCPKLLWLSCYKSEEAIDQNNDNILENGNEVGDLARHLFGNDYVLIEYIYYIYLLFSRKKEFYFGIKFYSKQHLNFLYF